MRIKIIAISLMFFISFNVLAQFSFKEKPLPDARVFLLTDFGFLERVIAINIDCEYWEDCNYGIFRHIAISEIGAMYNINDKFAIGANLATSYGFDDSFNAFNGFAKLRLRRWFSKDISVDIAPGIKVFGDHDFVVSADFRYKNWIIISLSGEIDELDDIEQVPLYVGVKIGDIPGTIGHGATGIGFLIALAIIAAGSN